MFISKLHSTKKNIIILYKQTIRAISYHLKTLYVSGIHKESKLLT